MGERDSAPPSSSADESHLVAPIRVVLADDSVLLREGIARLLEDAGFAVVGQSGTADDLMLKVRSYKPDVAIIDIRMPPTQTDEGLQSCQADSREASGDRAWSCSPSTSSAATPSSCSRTTPKVSATCSKTRLRHR